MTDKNRNTETLVYAALWLTAMGLYVLDAMQKHYLRQQPLFDVQILFSMLRTFVPFVLLFALNNYLLIPGLMLRNRWKAYIGAVSLLLVGMGGFQYYDFMVSDEWRRFGPPMHSPDMRPLLPMPVFMDIIYSLLVVGFNVAVALAFQRFEDRIERERLMKANAESRLSYLKTQINPHFYMNMLNNIHGMIDIDPEKAQDMVIDMSNLMRYMLYDSSKPEISLIAEIAFLENYLRLMRQRYPENKVAISARFPDSGSSGAVMLPPLLFLVFIENAFKHGVSYRRQSYVDVSIGISAGKVCFECRNSVVPKGGAVRESSGIGLSNIRQRLRLLYGDRAKLIIEECDDEYSVELTIPIENEDKDTDNR